MYEAQTGVPVAGIDYAPGRRTRKRKYPFDTMERGSMFFVPHKDKNSLASYAWTMGQELERKFSTRMTWMRLEDEKWVLCVAEDEGAVRGIGVWRTE